MNSLIHFLGNTDTGYWVLVSLQSEELNNLRATCKDACEIVDTTHGLYRDYLPLREECLILAKEIQKKKAQIRKKEMILKGKIQKTAILREKLGVYSLAFKIPLFVFVFWLFFLKKYKRIKEERKKKKWQKKLAIRLREEIHFLQSKKNENEEEIKKLREKYQRLKTKKDLLQNSSEKNTELIWRCFGGRNFFLKLPILDIDVEHISFLKKIERNLDKMRVPVMRGVDTLNREFIILRLKHKNKGVFYQTFLQMDVNLPMWIACSSNIKYSNICFPDFLKEEERLERLMKFLKGKIIQGWKIA